MTIHIEYYWPVFSFNAVATLQSGDEDAPLVLNGVLKNVFTNQVSFLDAGYSRSILIGSTQDNSAIQFTINGIQNGVAISEDIQGPNNGLVESVEIYDVITSIITNGQFTEIEVGTGYKGYMPIIPINTKPNTSIINYAIQSIFSPNTSLSYTRYRTLANIPQLKRTYTDLLSNTQYFVQNSDSDIDTGELVIFDSYAPYYLLSIASAPEEAKIDNLRIIFRQV